MATGKRILIVEDDPDYSTFLSTVLKKHDYETIVAPNGEEGLARARETPPDLVLLDLIMPKKSGMKFLNEVKADEHLRDVPVVIVSGAGQVTGVDMKYYFEHRPEKKHAAGKSETAEPAAFLEKPVDAKRLLEVVESLLG